MTTRFRNRTEAGQMLAKRLIAYANREDVLVLGLPRGGVPVAFEVAKALNAPLDICLVRKLGVPSHQELAMGAIASGGVRVLNYEVVNWLGISNHTIDEVAAQELRELQRRDRVYRGEKPQPKVKNRTVILVDDGIATSSTMRAAIAVLRAQQAQRIVVAVPVAPPATCEQLGSEVNEVICLITPEPLYAIGLWYEEFSQTSDEEVRDLLARGQLLSITNDH
ncbi:phosphoribosyltransferase [Nostocaceae cyanobacterium CENA369]|uniref:Phosphoribosyltransferase n=1 Tax=Dendronalium phyllosphericum CENA369 TaxID=1725256 RepID=A0A8J7LG73_9NOST|nr:phosphoribosyltransferase [Dendronalium phyllosphericum]MBH8572724.1 phosphoribosyltransferase [Dendronalium phyllosphericum CENA369]